MENLSKISLTDLTGNTPKCDLNSYELGVDKKVKIKESQLLSVDGWENYQKDLIQSCFEFWEVNDKQIKNNNSLNSDLEISDSEIQIPASLFAETKKKCGNIGSESKTTLDKINTSKELKNKEYSKMNDDILENKHENGQIIKRFSESINTNIDYKINEICSKMIDLKENKRNQKKLRKFSFYKHTSKQIKPNKKLQSFKYDTPTPCTLNDLWKYKKWLDSVEKIKKQNLNTDIANDNLEETSGKINCDEIISNYTLDIEAKQMEQKVRNLIKSLKEKDRLCTGIGINEQITKFGSSNKFKYFFKNTFRGNQNELNLQLLNDYTKYINQKLHTWQTLLDYLEDIRQKELYKIKITNLSEDTIEYRFSEKYEDDCKKVKNDECDDVNFKIVETNDSRASEMVKRKKKKFFKLLSKTAKTTTMMDEQLRDVTTVDPRTERYSVDSIRVIDFYRWASNKINAVEFLDRTVKNQRFPKWVRRSLSDTDLPRLTAIASSVVEYHNDRVSAGKKTSRFDCGKPWTHETSMLRPNNKELDRHRHHNADDMVLELRQERQERFRTAVARLEYVGSTFKEQCRLAGLKTLCKVDVLAGFGHSAEAVDLFVSTLPLSDNPDLMIRKAEAAYDWKFFCHLSMWRHSYKD